jgi:tRNA pseudouridine55 synthase
MEKESSGLLLIDKPAGMTSHDVIDRVRRITGQRTVGHAGTLDPFATGLLLVAVGREATKELSRFVGLNKTYEATISLGRASETFDTEGPISDAPCPAVTTEQLKEAMKKQVGEILQLPPMHSAIKIGGKKLYELARQGKEIERPARAVSVYSFESPEARTELELPTEIKVKIHCGSGTYIRAMARDLGIELGTAGYLTELRRTSVGPFGVDQAVKLDQLSPQNWIDGRIPPVLPSSSKS